MANDSVLNPGETLGDVVQPKQAAPQLNDGETLGDPVTESAASRFGSGVVAGAKAMIPTEVPHDAFSLATSGMGPLPEMVKGAYEGYKQARDEGQPIVSSVASGVGGVLGLDPEGIRERAAKGDIAGIVGEAVPSIAATIIGGEHERIGKAFHSDAAALKTATATRESTTATYAQRLAEQETATDQAIRATQHAKQLTDDLNNKEPNITQKHVDDANTNASAAAANARKATQALNDAHKEHAQAGVEVDRLGRKVQRSAAKASEKTTKAVAGAKEDFQKAIPSPASGKAAYSDRDYEIGRGYLEQHHQSVQTVGDVQGTYDAFDHIQKGMESKIAPYVQQFGDNPIKTNVSMDVRNALADNPRVDFVERGMRELENYNLKDPTVEEADTIRKQLNDENRATLKKNMWDIDTALGVDPEFAAKYAAADSLRNGIYDTFEDEGVKGIREMRQDEASIIKLRNAAERQLVKGDVKVRGSGESGLLRKAVGEYAASAGAGLGAAGGLATGIPGMVEAGAMSGDLLGKKLGGIIAPGDLTRSELIQRSMKVKGGGVPTTDIKTTPQSALREMGPLHSELATHYGEDVGQTSYSDLEARFKEDLRTNKAHGVPLEPAEKTLLGKINQSDAADKLAERKQIQEMIARGGKSKPTATLPDEVEPLFQVAPSKMAGGMDTQRGIVHDLAHAVVGDARGIKFVDGIRSHLHSENVAAGSLMSGPIDWTDFLDKDGNIDSNKMKSRAADLAATYVAGGVANDLYHDIPFTENHHLGADVRILRGVFKKAGFTEVEASKMIAQAADDAAQILGRPGTQDILEHHAAVREAGLSEKYHISLERMDQVIADVKGAGNENTGKSTAANGAVGKENREPGAGAEVTAKEGNTERIRPAGQGTAEGKGGKSGENEPANPAEPGGTAAGITAENLANKMVGHGIDPDVAKTRSGQILDAIHGEPGYAKAERTLSQQLLDKYNAEPESPKLGESEDDELKKTYQVIDKNGNVLSEHTTAKGARRRVDKLDSEYGASVHGIREKAAPENPKLGEAEEEEDNLVQGELQTPHKNKYPIQVIDREGSSHIEQVPAYSTQEAYKIARKKFPEASAWNMETSKPSEPGAGPTKYEVPTGKRLSVGTKGMIDANPWRTGDHVEVHELGHAMNGLNDGQTSYGMLRHNHPELGSKAWAAIQWSSKDLADPATHRIVPEKLPGLIRSAMGGIAADEAFNNLPREQNHNFQITVRGSDANTAYRLVKGATPGGNHEQVMGVLNRAVDQGKQYLTTPEVSGIIKENLGKREEGLSRQYHYSPGRLEQMHLEAQRRINAGKANNGPANGESGPGRGTNVPAGEEAGAGRGNEGVRGPESGARVGLTPESPKLGMPPERTTGDPEHDRIIKEGGGVPGGILGDRDSESHVKMFHDPQSGTTLGLGGKEAVTAEAVRAKLDASRAAYAAPQIAAHERDGGSTFSSDGKNLAGKDLYAVGSYPERTLQVDKLTPEVLAKFKSDNHDVLGQPGHAVGTWKDPDTGKAVLDISKTHAEQKVPESPKLVAKETPEAERLLGEVDSLRKQLLQTKDRATQREIGARIKDLTDQSVAAMNTPEQKNPDDMSRAELKTELGVTGDDPRNGLPNKVLAKQLAAQRQTPESPKLGKIRDEEHPWISAARNQTHSGIDALGETKNS